MCSSDPPRSTHNVVNNQNEQLDQMAPYRVRKIYKRMVIESGPNPVTWEKNYLIFSLKVVLYFLTEFM